MKALITGISGSGGSFLAEYIAKHHPECRIYGIYRNDYKLTYNLRRVADRVVLFGCNLNKHEAWRAIAADVQPDLIFHLASDADVRESWDRPVEFMQNNAIGAGAAFLESVRQVCPKARILICSTSEVYGQVDPKHVPITEECPLRPANPYAVSKLVQDALGVVYWKSYGMHIVRARAFTYTNPRRTNLFASSFAFQIARIEAGREKELTHGNLDSVRTIIDVRDVMRAYWLLLEKGEPGEVYNIGGSTVMTVGEVLEILKKMAHCAIPSRCDPNLLRPTDVTLQIPDCAKLKETTGWSQQYNAEDTLRNTLEYFRTELRRKQ